MHAAESRSLTHTLTHVLTVQPASPPNLGHTHHFTTLPLCLGKSHVPSHLDFDPPICHDTFSPSHPPPSCLHRTSHIAHLTCIPQPLPPQTQLSGDDHTWTLPPGTPRRCSYEVRRGAETGALVLRLWLCRRVCVVGRVLRVLCEVRWWVGSRVLCCRGV
jgi:hypothetical protein